MGAEGVGGRRNAWLGKEIVSELGTWEGGDEGLEGKVGGRAAKVVAA
jgi:hypothetical protein